VLFFNDNILSCENNLVLNIGNLSSFFRNEEEIL
jgi:hypothetical protein